MFEPLFPAAEEEGRRHHLLHDHHHHPVAPAEARVVALRPIAPGDELCFACVLAHASSLDCFACLLAGSVVRVSRVGCATAIHRFQPPLKLHHQATRGMYGCLPSRSARLRAGILTQQSTLRGAGHCCGSGMVSSANASPACAPTVRTVRTTANSRSAISAVIARAAVSSECLMRQPADDCWRKPQMAVRMFARRVRLCEPPASPCYRSWLHETSLRCALRVVVVVTTTYMCPRGVSCAGQHRESGSTPGRTMPARNPVRAKGSCSHQRHLTPQSVCARVCVLVDLTGMPTGHGTAIRGAVGAAAPPRFGSANASS